MGSGPSAAVLKQLHTLFQAGTVGGLTDGQLLEQFVRRRDETAFAALVERHGPMVLRVCRSRLGDRHDAEDAFQATFLVLAQKAPSIRKSEAVAGWLLGVACRVSTKARSSARRRMIAEQKIEPRPDAISEETDPQPWAELYEELERLPDKYRLPLVLCHLDGLTYEQAAMRLGCPVRTVQSRLIRGRERLRGRLVRRGLAPSAALAQSSLLPKTAPLTVPVWLNDVTVQVALRFANFKGAAAGVSPAAVILAKEVLRTMFLTQINTVAKLAVLLGLLGAGGWLAWPKGTSPMLDAPPKRTARREQAAPPPKDQSAPKKETPRYQMTGTVRLEGTDQPIAGAKVQVDLGTIDLKGDMREALTDADGHYTIPLPEGNARPWILIPPPGYWLPDSNKRFEFFAVTPRQPEHRKDYLVRRGNVWKFLLTSGPRHQPAPSASVSSYAMPGERPIPLHCLANNEGSATATLPSEGGKVTLSLSPKDLTETRLLVKLDWDGGFQPDAVKTLKRWQDPGQPAHFQLTDEAGRSATLSGPIDAAITAGQLVISASFPEAASKATGILAGTVLDQDGRLIADANVTISFAYRDWGAISSQDEHRTWTDAQGQYVLRAVPRQTYQGDRTKLSVVVYKDGFAGVDSPLSKVVERANLFQPGDAGTQVVETIRLQAGASLSGTVVDVEGRPVVGALIEPAGGWSQSNRTYRSGPNGRFTIPNLSKGVIRIAFTFGQLTELKNHVVNGQAEDLKVQLHAPSAGKPVAAAPTTASRTTLVVGQPAPEWRVRAWTDGKTRALADFRGKVVLLDFWGIWCHPCISSMPSLERLRAKYEPRGFVFLLIHTPEEEIDTIHRFLDLKKLPLISARDQGRAVDDAETASRYGVKGYPTLVMIDRQGNLAFHSGIEPRERVEAMKAVGKDMGLEESTMTESDLNRLFEAFYDREIEKVLNRP
jgi:RNA polymerase sigma factor (sigma-70 family)